MLFDFTPKVFCQFIGRVQVSFWKNTAELLPAITGIKIYTA
jgi:hypothetical protein